MRHGARNPTSGELRPLTVLFIDLVDSTPLSTELSPEEFRDLVLSYQEVLASSIEHHGGSILKLLGDGILAGFGYPEAHEDDPLRAMSGATACLAAASDHASRSPHPLSIRIGIDTGSVVVGPLKVGSSEYPADVIGPAPNVAQRLQSQAPTDRILISDRTRQVLPHYVKTTKQQVVLRGIPDSAPAWLLEGIEPDTLEVVDDWGVVGREHEAHTLQRWWDAIQGSGWHVTCVVGETGVGKSRLVREFKRQLGDCPIVEARCRAPGTHLGLRPLAAILEAAIRSSDQLAGATLAAALASHGLPAADAQAFSASLEIDEPSAASFDRRRRQALYQAANRLLTSMAQDCRVLLILEDLHFADQWTLEFISNLISTDRDARILSLFTYRSDFPARWPIRAFMDVMTLSRLSRAESLVMIREIAGDRIPTGAAHQIVDRADGIPLHVEQLTMSFLDATSAATDHSSPPPSIPARLHGSIQARIDRLGDAAASVLKACAIIDVDISYGAVAAASGLREPALRRALRNLVEAELLTEAGTPPDAHYAFRHNMAAEVAGSSLLRDTKARMHERVARALQADQEADPALIARHLQEAGLREEAIAAWAAAADRSKLLGFKDQAEQYAAAGLGLLSAHRVATAGPRPNRVVVSPWRAQRRSGR